MGGRSTRYERIPIEAQVEVDAYKARSVWGRWWALDPGVRSRLFSDEEIRWVKRFGRKLDALASLASEPETDGERHFVAVCQGSAAPTTDRERLWLRVRVVCKYEASMERASRCDLSEHRAATLEREIRQLRRDLRRTEQERDLLLEEQQLRAGDAGALLRRSIQNVDYATPLFATPPGFTGPRCAVRLASSLPGQRWVSQVLPTSRSRIDQRPEAAAVDVFAYR